MTDFRAASLLCAGLFFALSSVQAANIAVVIGVPHFRLDEHTETLQYAAHDARFFDGRFASVFAREYDAVSEKGMFGMQAVLNFGLLQAHKGDTVVIFISARGLARPGSKDGYLAAGDFVSPKEPSTGAPISYLQALLGET